MSFLWNIVGSFLSGLFSSWLKKYEAQKEIADATQPYKNEIEIKNRPAGTDSNLVDRL